MYTSNFVKNLLMSLSVVFFLGSLYYVGSTIILVFKDFPLGTAAPQEILSIALNLFILLFETITAFYGIYLFIHTALVFSERKSRPEPFTLHSEPLVSLIIPTFNPNLYALETNLFNIANLSYKNKEVFITDNSDNKEVIQGLENLCKRFNVQLIHRDGLQGFKAKNLNNALEQIKGKYFIIIDTDQSLKESSIEKFLYEFESTNDNKLAFVQGRFQIMNANTVIRTSIAILYTFFYDVISLAKSNTRAVLFNGSSGCFKTEIVRSIEGFPENCYTEDIAISNELLLRGYNSIYLNESVTTALVPWKLKTLLSSFWRWTHGGTSCLTLYGRRIISSKDISVKRKIELIMNTLSFIAISSILIIIFAVLFTYWLNVPIIRPILKLGTIGVPLFLFFPIFTSINHLLNCLIGMWESKTLYRIPYLVPYSIASIAISIFIVIPSFYALLGIKGPDSPKSKWNRNFDVPKVIAILSVLLAVFTISTLYAYLDANLLWISFASMIVVLLLPIIFLIKDYAINVPQEEFNYFNSFRKSHNIETKVK